MKIRYILIIAIVAAFFNYANERMKKTDFGHCRATTKFTVQECSKLTGYELKSK